MRDVKSPTDILEYRTLAHSRLTDRLAAFIDEETAKEEFYSTKLDLMLRFVHPDDRELFYRETRKEKIRC